MKWYRSAVENMVLPVGDNGCVQKTRSRSLGSDFYYLASEKQVSAFSTS